MTFQLLNSFSVDVGTGPWLRWGDQLISLANTRKLTFEEHPSHDDTGPWFSINAERNLQWINSDILIVLGTDRTNAKNQWEALCELLAIKPKKTRRMK